MRISSDTDLIDPATGNKYHILGAEGIELGKETYMPASGKIPCTLLFEAVPASVERLNMVEEGNQSHNNVYGVHLVKQAPKAPAVADDGTDPRTMTAEYYLSLPPSRAEVNIDYRRHRGMEFCKPATAHVKVHLDNYSPELGVSVVKLTGYDHVSNSETSVLAEIGPDHTYEADIPIDYPQYVLVDFPAASWLLIPGDTLEIFATINSDNTAFRSAGESAMINALNDKLLDRFHTRGYDLYRQMEDSVAAGRTATEAIIDQLSGEPVRFLYICEEAASPREAAEKWMAEKSIKGEHIYISSDDWNRLSHLFEFSSIPHAVLIGRDGKVIANGFRLSSADDLRKHLK